jgi:hypothetical protein
MPKNGIELTVIFFSVRERLHQAQFISSFFGAKQ